MNPVIVIAIVAIVAIVVVVAIANARRRNDGVDSFRRQIDALSPEARRSVVDQVQSAAERRDRDSDDARDDTRDDTDDDGDDPRGA
ncbi:MAG TPA: hypothetical protein VK917_04710 [Ilumatobacter sp.]|nr:hypothetical protein [Ilumatobacter sp.]